MAKSFLEKGKVVRSVKIKTRDGRWVKRSTGTGDEVTADRMADMADFMSSKHVWDVLDAITATPPTRNLDDVYAIWSSTPPQLHARTNKPMAPGDDERLQHVRDGQNVIDLDPIVKEWEEKGKANAQYVAQVRAMIPAGKVFPLTDYTVPNLQKHIVVDLGLSEATMRRYKAAHSAFCKRLKATFSHFTINIAKQLDLPSLPDYEAVFLEMPDARRLIEGYVTGEQQAIEALMVGSGIEAGGCAMLQRRDVDVKQRTVMVHPVTEGRHTRRKNKHRSRPIEVTEGWAWNIFYRHIKDMMPNAHVFPMLQGTGTNWGNPRLNRTPLDHHYIACRAAKLPETTLHSYRHTFATAWIDRGILGQRADGKNLDWARDQLGHARNSMQILTTYGVRIKQAKLAAKIETGRERVGT